MSDTEISERQQYWQVSTGGRGTRGEHRSLRACRRPDAQRAVPVESGMSVNYSDPF